MATLPDLMEYLISNYPKKWHLSNARLTKLVYLTDWVSALRNRKQVTSIDWYFDNYGPFVWDVLDTAKENPDRFEVGESETPFGSPKTMIALRISAGAMSLSSSDSDAADHVIRQTSEMNWNQFIRLVYSTYPVMTSDRYSRLDLVRKATEYQAQSFSHTITDSETLPVR